jgi:hypothetical protein
MVFFLKISLVSAVWSDHDSHSCIIQLLYFERFIGNLSSTLCGVWRQLSATDFTKF